MTSLKLKEAIDFAKKTKTVRKYDLAGKIWKDSPEASKRANFTNLISGKTRKIDIDAVQIICRELNVSADFLFGLTDIPAFPSDRDRMRNDIQGLVTQLDSITNEMENIGNNL